MALTDVEIDTIRSAITDMLATTPYTSTLSLVSGGTTNVVFRGLLEHPFVETHGTLVKSIIVKHSSQFARLNKSIRLDTTRAVRIA